MKFLFLTLLALSSLSLLLPASGRAVVTGGWSPFKNLSDPHVAELGGFAVTEHNKKADDSLVFDKVTDGEQQVVSGMNYRLVLEAKDGKGQMANYQAVVWEKSWTGFRQLTSFNPV